MTDRHTMIGDSPRDGVAALENTPSAARAREQLRDAGDPVVLARRFVASRWRAATPPA